MNKQQMKYKFYAIKRYLISLWYFKVLGCKRDRSKDHDCISFEESEVNISAFTKTGSLDLHAYESALLKKGKSIFHNRVCYGDGHYKCYECMNLDYENSDLIPNTDKP
jgi:hypothetical protein